VFCCLKARTPACASTRSAIFTARLDKLRRLLARCEHDAAGAPMRLVFVGDYIDRGPDSRGVIEHVMALQERLADSGVALMGNHEAMALATIDETNARR